MKEKSGGGKHVKIRIETVIGYWDKEFPISAKVKDVIYSAIRESSKLFTGLGKHA